MSLDCDTLAQEFYNLELDNGWIGSVDFLAEVPLRNESVAAQMSEDIFSRMIYENICPGKDAEYLMQQSVATAPMTDCRLGLLPFN